LCEHFGVIHFRNKDEIADDRIEQARVFVLAGPKEKFTSSEVNNILDHFYVDLFLFSMRPTMSKFSKNWHHANIT